MKRNLFNLAREEEKVEEIVESTCGDKCEETTTTDTKDTDTTVETVVEEATSSEAKKK